MVWTLTDFVHLFVRIMPFFKRGEISEDIVVGVSVISIFEHEQKTYNKREREKKREREIYYNDN